MGSHEGNTVALTEHAEGITFDFPSPLLPIRVRQFLRRCTAVLQAR
jgi:hypothetical protein